MPAGETLTDLAIAAAEPHYRRAIASMLKGDRRREAAAWDRYAEITARSIMLHSLRGHARVGDMLIDSGVAVPQSRRTFALTEAVLKAGPFREAVDGFRHRVPMFESVVRTAWNAAQSMAQALASSEREAAEGSVLSRLGALRDVIRNAFWVKGLGKTATARVQSLVMRAIEKGHVPGSSISLPKFIDRAQLEGASNLTRARLEVVYRNNLNGAFNQGQMDALYPAAVRKVIPLVMVVEVMDRRTRGNPRGLYPDRGVHWQMNGYINTPEYLKENGLIPPCGHNCRGGLKPIPSPGAKRLGLVLADGTVDAAAIRRYNGRRQTLVDRRLYPDPGWIART